MFYIYLLVLLYRDFSSLKVLEHDIRGGRGDLLYCSSVILFGRSVCSLNIQHVFPQVLFHVQLAKRLTAIWYAVVLLRNAAKKKNVIDNPSRGGKDANKNISQINTKTKNISVFFLIASGVTLYLLIQ
eukprot:gene3667-2597_t